MSHNGKRGGSARDPIAVWDAILDTVAEDDMENHVPTDDDMRWSQGVDVMVQSRLAELQRQLTPSHPLIQQGVAIPLEVQGLSRVGLLAQIETLRRTSNVQYAHQDLTGLSDNDLRTMLAILLKRKER